MQKWGERNHWHSPTSAALVSPKSWLFVGHCISQTFTCVTPCLTEAAVTPRVPSNVHASLWLNLKCCFSHDFCSPSASYKLQPFSALPLNFDIIICHYNNIWGQHCVYYFKCVLFHKESSWFYPFGEVHKLRQPPHHATNKTYLFNKRN